MTAAMIEVQNVSRAFDMLRAVEGLSGTETAECLGIPEDTVKTRLHRARVRLQESLRVAFEPAIARALAFEAPRCNRVVAALLQQIGAAG